MINPMNMSIPIQNNQAINLQNQPVINHVIQQNTNPDLEHARAISALTRKNKNQLNVKTSESHQELTKSIQILNQQIQQYNQGLQLIADKATGKYIAKLIDMNTGNIIRQIPPDERMEISQNINTISGLIFNKKT